MDNAYAAGLIDGEGTITLGKEKASSKYRHPVVSMASTTHELLQFMKDTFGGYITPKKATKPNHSDSWHWCIIRTAALNCLSKTVPFLKEPDKRRRALLLLNEYSQVTVRNGKYSDEQRDKKIDFERRFFHPSTS